MVAERERGLALCEREVTVLCARQKLDDFQKADLTTHTDQILQNSLRYAKTYTYTIWIRSYLELKIN